MICARKSDDDLFRVQIPFHVVERLIREYIHIYIEIDISWKYFMFPHRPFLICKIP